MHSVSAGAHGPSVVFMPGYCAGSGFYYRNLAGLVDHLRVHLVDWLGTGLSGRPTFPCKSREESEAWFIESLEEWRKQNELEQMVLVGHSLGGYLASNYALQYPGRVQHLVLVCPAGMSKKPADWQPPETVRSPWTLYGQMYRNAKRAWEWGVTPGGISRMLGPAARKMSRFYAQRRMHSMLGISADEAASFEPYLYQIWSAPGSGEYALRHLLAPFAWGRAAMEDRLDGLQVPVTFIYGEHDWMDPAGAHRICANLKKLSAQRPPADNDCAVITIPESGHFTFLERPLEFNALLLETLGHLLDGTAQPHTHEAVHKGEVVDASNEGVTVQSVETAFLDS